MADPNFEEAKAFLQREVGGTSMFDHISEVFIKILAERPDDPLEIFEQLSEAVKGQRVAPSSEEEYGSDPAAEEATAAATEYCNEVAGYHVGTPVEDEDGGEEGEIAPSRPEVVQDLIEAAGQWEAAGVNPIGTKADAIRMSLSLSQLAGADDSIETIRFWGKLLGRDSDYLVAEGTKSGSAVEEDEEEGNLPEPEANKFTYWVCSTTGSTNWVELPQLTPKAIICARQLRRFLTGNLDAPVSGFPVFPGSEKHLVRAVIALVNSDCALAPSGYFVVEEDATEATISEEYEAQESAAEPAGWQQYGVAFNELGRVMPLETEDEEGNTVQTPEGWEFEPLRAVEPEEWVAKLTPQHLPGNKAATVVLRAKKWPGAYAINHMASGKWTNIYVGYGTQFLEETYTPPMPAKIQQDFDATELVEQEDLLEDPSPPAEEDE